jgi:hypothetical protein
MIEALLFRLRADSVGLTLGPHKVRFELADPTHQVITGKTIDKVTNYGGSTLIPPRTRTTLFAPRRWRTSFRSRIYWP